MNNLEDAHELIDTAISTALKESKPVYISIGCNLPAIPHPTFARDPVPFFLAPKYVFCLLIIQPFFFLKVSVISFFAYDPLMTTKFFFYLCGDVELLIIVFFKLYAG